MKGSLVVVAVALLLTGCSSTSPSVPPSSPSSASSSTPAAAPSSASPSARSASPSARASRPVQPTRSASPSPTRDCENISDEDFAKYCMDLPDTQLPEPVAFDEPYVLDGIRTEVTRIAHRAPGTVALTVKVTHLGQRPSRMSVTPTATLSYARGEEKLPSEPNENGISYSRLAKQLDAFGDLPPLEPRESLSTTVTFGVPEASQRRVAFNFAVNSDVEWSTFVGSLR